MNIGFSFGFLLAAFLTKMKAVVVSFPYIFLFAYYLFWGLVEFIPRVAVLVITQS